MLVWGSTSKIFLRQELYFSLVWRKVILWHSRRMKSGWCIDTAVDKAVEPEDLDVDETVNEDNEFEGEDEAEVPLVFPEEVMLSLPSNIISVEFREPLESLRLVERELRKGQANDSLEGLRVALANKSLLLLTNVNQSTTTKQST
jgi:hypothetical protein